MKKIILLLFLSGFVNLFSQKLLIPKLNLETKIWEYHDTTGNVILKLADLSIENALFFSDDLAPVQDAKTKLWGYINAKGKFVIKPHYEQVDFFKDGYAIVRNECKKDCNQGNEGLLSSTVGYIIDKSGKIISQDNSQDESAFKRYFLLQNLGKGLFSIQRGISLGEKQDFMNYKAEVLGETITSYGSGGIFWDDEVKAVKCGAKYFDTQGKIVLDLTKYQLIFGKFVNGYVWTSQEKEISPDVFESIYTLVDLKGNEIVSFKYNDYDTFSEVKNGEFTTLNKNDLFVYSYNIKSKTFTKLHEFQFPEHDNYEVMGSKLSDGSTLIYSENGETLVGIMHKNGRKFYLEPTE
jgi:hypothetical protein